MAAQDNSGVRFGDRQKFVVKKKYRGATKRSHRGGIKNIVAQQKIASR